MEYMSHKPSFGCMSHLVHVVGLHDIHSTNKCLSYILNLQCLSVCPGSAWKIFQALPGLFFFDGFCFTARTFVFFFFDGFCFTARTFVFCFFDGFCFTARTFVFFFFDGFCFIARTFFFLMGFVLLPGRFFF
jgi:hypothetical protein